MKVLNQYTPAQRAAKRRYYLANRDKVIARIAAQRRKVPPELAKEYRRRCYVKHIERRRKDAKAHYRKNRKRILAARAARRLVDPTVLAKMRVARGLPAPTRPCPTQCELCDRVLERGKIHLDHDHVTGAFRGWLCNRCNLALGHLGDNIQGIKRALAYLVKNGSS